MADNILSDFGINILEEEIDDVIFQTNEFLTDATFTGSQGPFWWILQMCMALAALFSIIVAASMAYKMMVKNEPLDVMKLFKPLVVSIILCWWYPPADTGMTNSGSSWCVLDFLSYIPNCIEQIYNYCENNQIPLRLVEIDTLEKAKQLPCIFNNWAVFYNGKFETVHLLNEGLLKKLLQLK